MSGEYVISLVLSFHSRDLKHSGWVLQLAYSSEFYSASQGKYTLEMWEQVDPKGEASIHLGFFFLIHLSLAPSLPYGNWPSQGGCFSHLRFLLWSSDFLFFHFRGLFHFFVFKPPSYWTPFSYSNCLTDWRQAEKGMTEDEMVGWHHWLKEHEFEQTPGDSEGQGRLECCAPWGQKESDMT